MATLIFFSDDRSGIPTSSMHLADQLAKNNRVFWLNTYMRMPNFSLRDVSKAVKVLAGCSGKPTDPPKAEEQSDGIRYFTPKIVPWFIPPVRKINGILGKRFLQKLFRDYDIQSPVLITTYPSTVDTFRAVRSETKQFYYCVDEWAEHPGLNRKQWQKMEQDLLAVVDGAAFTSRKLLNDKKNTKVKHLYLPHGVDYNHFSSGKGETIDLMELMPKPIIGYFGVIGNWVDVKVVEYLARRFPKYSFVMIGNSSISLDFLRPLPNVHLLGRIAYADLPKYASYFDVGLNPFVMNELTLAVNPLKLMEYYALGIPVISSKLPDILDTKGPIFFAETHDEFGDRLEEIFQSDLQSLKQTAQDTARKNSWASRADDLSSFIETL